jgi:hypothetical protein
MSLNPLKPDLDPIGWAKFPRSANALDHIIQASKAGDERFRDILAGHVRDGVCDDKGQLLLMWSDGQWVRPPWYVRANYDQRAA